VDNEQRIILGVTGSIAAYKSADIARNFKEKGCRVSVVMTKEAENFITPLTLSSLTGEQVYSDMFAKSIVDGSMPHIELAKEASALLIAPATANIIGKIASGIADDLLTCIALATKAKILIAPAMNVQMYKNEIVQGNCAKLKKYGMTIIEPVEGNLACGDFGEGHLAEEHTIVDVVLQAIS